MPDDIIRYRGKTYQLPRGQIVKIAKEHSNLEKIAKAIHITGYDGHLVNLEPECGLCPHMTESIEHGYTPNNPGKPGVYVPGCKYKERELEWATDLGDGMFTMTNCLVNDLLVKQLILDGALDSYEVDNAPKYRRLPKPQEETLVDRVKRQIRRSTPGFLRDLLYI